MTIIYILIPIAIIFTAVAIYLFFWAVKTEQFDDLEKQGMSILFDDEKTLSSQQSNRTQSKKVQTPDSEQHSPQQHKSHRHKTAKEQQTDTMTHDSDDHS